MAKKGKVLKMPEMGIRLTMNGVDIGPRVSERDARAIERWIAVAHKDLYVYWRRAQIKNLEGWGCSCSCHRLRQWTVHCIGCSDGKHKKV